MRRPTSAPASWIARRRRSFVSTVQWHWSSSSRAGGPPRTAFESSRTSGESSSPHDDASPDAALRTKRREPSPQAAAGEELASGRVSCVGRSSATTERLRSSPQTAATIGTGSSAARLMRRVETGSRRASVASTVRTPRSPSASPTAAPPHGRCAVPQSRARSMQRTFARSTSRRSRIVAQHDIAVDVAAREEVDVGEPELGPGVDAEVRLGEQEHARHGAVRKARGTSRRRPSRRRPPRPRGGSPSARRHRSGPSVAHPRVHRVEAHRLSCVLSGSRDLSARRSSSSNRSPWQRLTSAAPGHASRAGELEEKRCSRVGSGDAGERGETHSHRDAPPSTVA